MYLANESMHVHMTWMPDHDLVFLLLSFININWINYWVSLWHFPICSVFVSTLPLILSCSLLKFHFTLFISHFLFFSFLTCDHLFFLLFRFHIIENTLILLCLTYFFNMLSCKSIFSKSSHFCGWVILHYVCIPYFLKYRGLFCILGVVNSPEQVSISYSDFIFLTQVYN